MSSKAIKKAMALINEEYSGKFVVSDARIKLWTEVLRGFTAEIILAATYHLVTTRKDWPPDIATLREQCANISLGRLSSPTGAEAWERIRQKMLEPRECENPMVLTPEEKKVLAQTTTLYDLSKSTNYQSDRAQFTRAYDSLIAKQQTEQHTLPMVQKVIQNQQKLLTGETNGKKEEK